MAEIQQWRLHLLRAAYALIAIGLAIMIWPSILFHAIDVPHLRGVVRSMLGAVAVLAAVGIWQPLRMIPVLLFELVWKAIWILSFGIPLWAQGRLDPAAQDTMFDAAVGIVVVIVAVPWRHVLNTYMQPSPPWRSSSPHSAR